MAENQPIGTTVGTLSTTDPEDGTFTYSLVAGTGSTDNGSFEISGNLLQAAASFNYEADSSCSIRVRTTDAGGLWCEETFTIAVTDVNEAPTTIQLSNSTVREKQPVGTTVGRLSTADPDSDDNFTYSLVPGKGGKDNDLFSISGNTLQTAVSFNYGSKNNYSIRVRTTDSGGLVCERVFTITVTGGNQAPTAIQLSNSSVLENQPAGTTVGKLSTTDPDSGDNFTYSLVQGKGGKDNNSFRISGDTLLTAASFDYEARNNYSIRVRTTDSGGLTYEQAFTVTVIDVNESSTAVQLSNSVVPEDPATGMTVGTLSTTDPDSGDTFAYNLVEGAGSMDNSSFGISGNTLQTAIPFADKIRNNYSIRVRATDSRGEALERAFTILVSNQSDVNYRGTEGTDTFTVKNSQDNPVTVNIFDFNPEEYDRIDLRDWGLPPSTAFSNLATLQDQRTGDTIIKLSELTTVRLVGFPLPKLKPDDFIF